MALSAVPPLTVVALRLIVSAVCFVVWFAIKERRLALGPRGLFWQIILLSLFGTSFHYSLQTVGLQFTTATNASIYAITGPISIIIISALFLNEKVTIKKATGIILAIGGVILVMGPDELLSFNIKGHLLGDILVLVSIVLWGAFTVYGKKLTGKLSPLELTSAVTVWGALSMIPVGLWEIAKYDFSFALVTIRAWLAIAFLGITCSFLATLFYMQALEKTESQKVGVFLYTIPVITYITAALFFEETSGILLLLGSILVFSGVYITERR
jgi:drug/metabolite transporter (DMT)-like permease